MLSSLNRRSVLKGASALAMSAALPKGARAQNQADVLVIGAGLSGLNAALMLQDEGLNVTVIEGRNRIGGRMYTLDEMPFPAEAGGNGMGGGYARMIDTADRLGIELFDYVPRMMKDMMSSRISMNGQLLDRAGWAASADNPFPDEYKSVYPFEYAMKVIAENNPLSAPEEWIEPQAAQYDIPLYEFFKLHGASDEMITLAYETNCNFGNSSHDVSALMMFFIDKFTILQREIAPVQLVTKGGNQRFPEAMANALKNEVHLNKVVTGIRTNSDNVEVVCEDGSKYTANYVINSMPLPVLNHIRMDPMLTGDHAKAMKMLRSQAVTQVHVVPKTPFWEEDGLGTMMWTDTIAGNITPGRFNLEGDEITSFNVWSRGFKASYIDRLSPEDAKAHIIAEIEAIRPAAKGQLEAPAMHSWMLDPFAGGDWAVWGPGQIKDFREAVTKPHGRMHFCGEHTAEANRGMEGAMESGERVAIEILEQI